MAPRPPPPSTKKFGAPLYGSAWVNEHTLLVCGGGGKKSSGIPNRIMVATFDGVELSEPLTSVHTGEEAPTRLTMHPDGKELLAVFSGDVAVYKVEANKDALAETEESEPPEGADSPVKISPKEAEDDRVKLSESDIKVTTFSKDGTKLAIGLESGEVQMVSWPALKVEKIVGKHTDAITDIAFSPCGKFLLTTSAEVVKADKGAAVWSVEKGERVKTLSDPSIPANARGTVYRFAAFGPEEDKVAYTGLNLNGEGYIVKWDTEKWTVKQKYRVFKEPISAFAFSPKGESVAAGCGEGHIAVINCKSMSAILQVKSAHMIFVTTMCYNVDGSVVVSCSADASAHCTSASEAEPTMLGTLIKYLFALAFIMLIGYLYLFVYVPFIMIPPELDSSVTTPPPQPDRASAGAGQSHEDL